MTSVGDHSGQQCPHGGFPLTIGLSQQNYRSLKVSSLLSKVIPFIFQIHSCQAEMFCLLACSFCFCSSVKRIFP